LANINLELGNNNAIITVINTFIFGHVGRHDVKLLLNRELVNRAK